MPVRARWIEFIFFKAYAQLRVDAERYYIGYLWWILEPALEMAVYYVIFAMVMARYTENFALFILCGLISWRWFHTSVLAGARSISANQALASQVFVPKVVFPLVVVVVSTAKFLLVLALFAVIVNSFGLYAGAAYAAIPVVFVVQLTFVLATTIILAGIQPLFTSIEIVINTALRIGFFASGVFFAIAHAPAHLQPWLRLNPMLILLESWRRILLDARTPDWTPLAAIFVLSCVGIAAGVQFIRRNEFEYPRLSQ